MNGARWSGDPDRPRSRSAVRVFRAALRLAPRRFRLNDGEGLAHLFSEVHAERLERSGRVRSTLGMMAEAPGLMRMIASAWWTEWHKARHAGRQSAASVQSRRKLAMIDTIRFDLRGAARFLRTAPGVAATAILTIALGVGANTAMFSLVHGVLLKPLALSRPERLVAIGEARPTSSARALNSTSPASFLDWKASAPSASGMAAYSGRVASITGFGDPEAVLSVTASGNLFDVIGVRPLFGRALLLSDESPDAPHVVVLSYLTWQQLFGENRNVIGQSMTVNRAAVTIVGVMPPGFTFPGGTVAFWEPTQWTPQERVNRDQYYLQVVARLRDGASPAQLQTELTATAQRLRRDWSEFNTNLVLHMLPLQESIVGGSRQQLLILMGAVVLVLLIACANLANLMMARASARRREIVVRQALGAGWTRIVRQLLTESVVLSLLGGLAAVAVGKLLMRVLVTAMRGTLPRVEDIGFDQTVLAFTLGVSLAAGIAFGLVPAIQLARGRSSEVLRDGARSTGGRQAGRQALVVVQLALGLMLLAGAGLLLRSFSQLGRVNPGFNPSHLLAVQFTSAQGNPRFVDALLERVGGLPGVTSVALTNQVPDAGRGNGAWFNMYSRPVPAGQTPPAEAYRVVTPGFFNTVGVPFLRGRQLGDGDSREGTPSVIVNEALSRKYWPDGDALGQEIYLGAPDSRLFPRATIVGVVADTREAGLGLDPIPVVYVPRALMPYWRAFTLVARTTGVPMALVPAIRREVRVLDPLLTLRNPQAVDTMLGDSLASARWSLILLASFAAVAIVMAALGVFGVLSYLVAQRTRELGIRLALGAAPGRLRGMVVGQGLRLTAIGVVIGLAGAYALNGSIRGMLFGVKSTDPVTYAAVAVALVGIGALASWIPARRTTRVDPTIALRDG